MSTENRSSRPNRKSLRFSPDINTLAHIDLDPSRSDASFQPSLVGLVHDEAATGVGIVVLKTEALQIGTHCRVQVGSLHPLLAEVRWVRALDDGVLRVGIIYLE